MRFGLMEAVGETGSPDATNGMGRAWRAAWRGACDSAWDAGVRWSPVDTERGIAGRIAECLEAVTPEGESDFGAYLAELADHVTAGASDVRRAVAGTVARVVHPSRRRRETTRQCGLADVQMAVPGVIAQKNMMRVSKVRCRDTLEILATCRVRHASCKSWRLVFR